MKEALSCLSVNFPTEENCMNAPTSDDTKKICIYDSANNKCKESLSCLSANFPTEENCKNAPTSDDTKKICIYDETTQKCQEVDKPSEKTNDGGEKDDTPTKKKKSGNFKTVKIMKEFKELKRYRTVKRLKKLIGLKN